MLGDVFEPSCTPLGLERGSVSLDEFLKGNYKEFKLRDWYYTVGKK